MSKNRIFGLDILRAFAILSVLYIHCLDFLPESRLLNNLKLFEFDGVLFFFVLSGFLIGNIMIKVFSTSLNFSDLTSFWIRRWYRTIPNYLLVLLLLIFVYAEYKWRIFKFVFFIQGFFKPQADFYNESWSLAVEEWFYLLFPLFLYLLKLICKIEVNKSIIYMSMFIIISIPILRYIYFQNYNITDRLSWDYYIRQITVLRFDSIIFGVVGAYLYNFRNEYWVRYKKISFYIGIIFILLFKLTDSISENIFWDSSIGLIYMTVFHFTVMSFSILLLLPYLSDFKLKSNNYFTLSITKISLISYSVYLLNYSLIKNYVIAKLNEYLVGLLSADFLILINTLLFYSLTIGLSLLLYRYFELPVMNLRDKLNS